MIEKVRMQGDAKHYLLENYTQIIEYWKLPFWKRWLKNPPVKNLVSVESQYIPLRRAGNTTRIANKAVGLILSGEKTRILDHYTDSRSNLRLLDIILARLSFEHGVKDNRLLIDRRKNTVYNCIEFYVKLKS